MTHIIHEQPNECSVNASVNIDIVAANGLNMFDVHAHDQDEDNQQLDVAINPHEIRQQVKH